MYSRPVSSLLSLIPTLCSNYTNLFLFLPSLTDTLAYDQLNNQTQFPSQPS